MRVFKLSERILDHRCARIDFGIIGSYFPVTEVSECMRLGCAWARKTGNERQPHVFYVHCALSFHCSVSVLYLELIGNQQFVPYIHS